MSRYIYISIIFIICILSFGNTYAQEFNSSSFKVLDPVIVPSGFSSSVGFKLWSNISEIALGTSSSSSYNLGAGFLRFPFASSPVVSATAGDSSVHLSWTSSNGFLGWTATSYTIGRSVTSGGPYIYGSTVSSLNSTVTGLNNDTTYYFIVKVNDAFGNHIATSSEASATPIASTVADSGGGGSSSNVSTGVIFSGIAYPYSKVTILRDGLPVLVTTSEEDSRFSAILSDLNEGNYNFGVYSEDSNNLKSNIFTFFVSVKKNNMTEVNGIFISPTISLNKKQVKKGDDIMVYGYSADNAKIIASLYSDKEKFFEKDSNSDGYYTITLNTSDLDRGGYYITTKASKLGIVSDFSKVANFIVGDENIFLDNNICNLKGDVDNNCRVNLVDFSIVAFWYKKANPAKHVDINEDNRVDILDFSIMAFNWTG